MHLDMAGDTIASYFAKVLSDYEQIRGKDVYDLDVPFWDVVIITTADTDQCHVFQAQIKQKLERRELPLGVPIHVINDPPGPKLGNGGSTFTALKFLNDYYGSEGLIEKRVLLIHAGGQSQRMPSASVLGKIFSPVPKGNPIFQMLDIKLATFLPMLPLMCPGVFVTCADDFLIYSMPKKPQDVMFAESGFTALAHPSSVVTGTGHGVYLIDEVDKINPQESVHVATCRQVLQKPSEQLMVEKNAMLDEEDLTFSGGIKITGRAVYTDSSFFFAHDVSKALISYYDIHGPIDCEIDAYGDFLQALGREATGDYVKNTSNVSTVTAKLLVTRQQICNLLNKFELALIVMNSSKFIHIGTTQEYIDSFCCDSVFQAELDLSKDVYNYWASSSPKESDPSFTEEPPVKRARVAATHSDTVEGCVMHSVLPAASNIAETSVIEYCNFSIPVNVGQNCIVSGCELVHMVKNEEAGDGGKEGIGEDGDSVWKLPDRIDILNDTFLHTIPVTDEGTTKYATVVFSIKDNLKQVAVNSDIHRLPYLGKYVKDYAATVKVDLTKVKIGMDEPGSKVNLWFASLFPLATNMTQSLLLALKSVEAMKKDDLLMVNFAPYKLVSMATILKQKNVVAMLEHRSRLFEKIKSNFENP